MAQTRSSNATSVSVAEESSYKTLPAVPKWYQYQPFEMGDIGGEPTLVEPNPYREDQSMDFGRKVDVTASGGFQTYVNGLNILRLLQGYFVSSAHEQYSTNGLNASAPTAISAITTSRITLASTGDDLTAGDIILVGGCTGAAAANNGVIGVVTGSPTATSVTVTGTPFTAATTGLGGAFIQKVGIELASGIASLVVSGTTTSLAITGTTDFTTQDLLLGSAICIGGDDPATRFSDTLKGFVRLRRIEARRLTFDNPSFTPVANPGTGKRIQLFFGTVLRNRLTEAERTKRSYVIERTLGEGASPNTSQAQYVIGAAPSSLTLAFPLANLVTSNFNYMPAKPEYEPTAVRSGTRYPAVSYDDYFNTTSDLVLARVSTITPAVVPSDFFGLASEYTFEQTNNVTQVKAQGIEGAADVSYGDFVVTGSVTAYFETVEALRSIIGNAKSQFHCYYGHNNHGFAVDLPLCSLSGGILGFTKNQPITVPLNLSAAKSDSIGEGFGHVMMYTYFPYLPTIQEGRAD